MTVLTTIKFDNSERRDFANMYDVITDLANIMNGKDIVNTGTGEAITADELFRVRGILDGLRNKDSWIVAD